MTMTIAKGGRIISRRPLTHPGVFALIIGRAVAHVAVAAGSAEGSWSANVIRMNDTTKRNTTPTKLTIKIGQRRSPMGYSPPANGDRRSRSPRFFSISRLDVRRHELLVSRLVETGQFGSACCDSRT
jgi:hypothetical protein